VCVEREEGGREGESMRETERDGVGFGDGQRQRQRGNETERQRDMERLMFAHVEAQIRVLRLAFSVSRVGFSLEGRDSGLGFIV
jgi:hypothetical protein